MLEKRKIYWLSGLACLAAAFGFLGYYQHVGAFVRSPETKTLSYRVSTGVAWPSLNYPRRTTTADADNEYRDTMLGVVVEGTKGAVRFYPLSLLHWHEVINDTLDGQPIAVTYSPLSGSVAVYARGEEDLYFASESLVNNISVLQKQNDPHDFLQLNGAPVDGSADGLVSIPYTLMTWKAWKEIYAYGQVVWLHTDFDFDYARTKYAYNYDVTSDVYYPYMFVDSDFDAKAIVYGVKTDDTQLLFAHDDLVAHNTLTHAARMHGISGILEATIDDVGTVRIVFIADDQESNQGSIVVAFVRTMAFAYLTLYPHAEHVVHLQQ